VFTVIEECTIARLTDAQTAMEAKLATISDVCSPARRATFKQALCAALDGIQGAFRNVLGVEPQFMKSMKTVIAQSTPPFQAAFNVLNKCPA
jgi:hypothetical protein